ncbi:MAG: hypothetical protein KJ645_03065, partial [Planctomycetes bacterium]|nr:hypothetical protein [Planctomycetota bacterium]
SGSHYEWDFIALGLDYNLAGFDFNSFAFSDITGHGSHIAIDYLDIDWNLRRHTRYLDGDLIQAKKNP